MCGVDKGVRCWQRGDHEEGVRILGLAIPFSAHLLCFLLVYVYVFSDLSRALLLRGLLS